MNLMEKYRRKMQGGVERMDSLYRALNRWLGEQPDITDIMSPDVHWQIQIKIEKADAAFISGDVVNFEKAIQAVKGVYSKVARSGDCVLWLIGRIQTGGA